MAKNSGKNVPVARGEAHAGAKSSWLGLTDLDRQQPNSLVLSAQRHQYLTVRGNHWMGDQSRSLNFFASCRDVSV
jgi:hypothetical protein